MSFKTPDDTARELHFLANRMFAARKEPIEGAVRSEIKACAADCRLAPDDPLVMGGLAVTHRAEESGHELAYHNGRHALDVVMSYTFLVRSYKALKAEGNLPRISLRETMLGAVVAAGHDIGHDGLPNGSIPSRLEKKAAAETNALLARAGVDEDMRGLARALILLTDPELRRNALAPAIAALDPGRGIDRGHFKNELAPLDGKGPFIRLAELIVNADILASVAMGKRLHLENSHRLATERGQPYSTADSILFLERMPLLGVTGTLLAAQSKGLKSAMLEYHLVQEAVGKWPRPLLQPAPGRES